MRHLLIATTILALTGCTVKPPIEPRADPYPSKQIHMDSEELRLDTAVDAPIFTRNESGLLVATIPIRATIDKTLYLDYRVTYFDSNRVPLSTVGPFSKKLLPNVPDRIQVTATDPKAADLQVDFYYSR